MMAAPSVSSVGWSWYFLLALGTNITSCQRWDILIRFLGAANANISTIGGQGLCVSPPPELSSPFTSQGMMHRAVILHVVPIT